MLRGGDAIEESPAYWVEFATGLPDLELEGNGYGQWVEDVSFHGTLDEGIFTID